MINTTEVECDKPALCKITDLEDERSLKLIKFNFLGFFIKYIKIDTFDLISVAALIVCLLREHTKC